MEYTVIILKPDALERGLHFDILGRIERVCNLRVVYLEMMLLDTDDVDFLYPHQAIQPFYPAMMDYLTFGPVIIAVYRGEGAVEKVRAEIGHYDKSVAQYVSLEDNRLAIRSEFVDVTTPNYVNLIHASGTHGEAVRESTVFAPGITFEYA